MPAQKKQNKGTFWDDREGTRDGGCGVGKKNLSENLLQLILVREAATDLSPADHLKLCLTRSWGSEAGVTYFIRCNPTTTCRGFGSGWSLLSSYVRTYECSRGVMKLDSPPIWDWRPNVVLNYYYVRWRMSLQTVLRRHVPWASGCEWL